MGTLLATWIKQSAETGSLDFFPEQASCEDLFMDDMGSIISTSKLYLDIHLDMHINQLIDTFVESPPTFSHEFVIEAKLNGTFINLIVHIQVGVLI